MSSQPLTGMSAATTLASTDLMYAVKNPSGTPTDNKITVANLIATLGINDAFNALTSGTNTTAAMVVGSGGSLTPSGTGTIQATSIASTIVASTNITITGAGTVASPYSISASSGGGGGITFNNVTGTSQAASINNGYVTNNASLVTVTLPSTAAIGSIVAIVGSGAGGWKVAQNSGQSINFGALTSTAGTSGSIASTQQYDCLELICTVANSGWVARSYTGSLTVA